MTVKLLGFLAILLSFAVLPQMLLIDVFAKFPMYNGEHTFGQFMQLLIVPMGIAIIVLGVWAIRARQQPIATK